MKHLIVIVSTERLIAMPESITVEIVGKPSYLRWTLEQWVLEVKDIIELEYDAELVVKTIDSDNDLPVLRIAGSDAFIGLPSEEGYLIEILKKKLEEIGVKKKEPSEAKAGLSG